MVSAHKKTKVLTNSSKLNNERQSCKLKAGITPGGIVAYRKCDIEDIKKGVPHYQ